MSAILKFDFQKREQLRFSEVNYLNLTKRPNFACGNYIYPKTRGNKNKSWTHSTTLNSIEIIMFEKMLRYVRPNLYGTTYLKSAKRAGGQANPLLHTLL